MTRYRVTGRGGSWLVWAADERDLAAKIHTHYRRMLRQPYEVRLDLDHDCRLTGKGVVLDSESWAVHDRLAIAIVWERAAA